MSSTYIHTLKVENFAGTKFRGSKKPAFLKTLRFGCMQYRALADYSAKARLRSLIGE